MVPEPQFGHRKPHTEARGQKSNHVSFLRDNNLISSCFDVRGLPFWVSQWSLPVVLPQRPLPPESPNAPPQDTENRTPGWGRRVPGSIDSRAGPRGYGFSIFCSSLGGSGSLKMFQPPAKHRDGFVWHVVTGGKPNARRGKNLWGESCIFRLYSLELPFLPRGSDTERVCSPPRGPYPDGGPAVARLGRICGVGLLIPLARVVPPAFTGLAWRRQEVPSKAGPARLVPFLL